MPRRTPQTLPKALSPEQRRRVLACLRDHGERLMVGLLLYTGLRAAEALALDWGDIDLRERRLLVRRGKGNKQRIIPVAAPLLEILCESYKSVGPVLTARGGNRLPYSTLHWRIREIGKRAGVPWLTPHKFRHTAATALQKVTGDLSVTQRFLGHTNIATTAIYLHVTIDDVEEGLDRVEW